MSCPICWCPVRYHSGDEALRCYELYLRRTYDDPQPSAAWVTTYA